MTQTVPPPSVPKFLLRVVAIFVAMIFVHSAARAADVPNLYWPGTFEGPLFGGNFSSAMNVAANDGANHTPGGSKAWQLAKGYQHLELLTDGVGEFEVGFHAKSGSPFEVVVKGIARDPLSGKPVEMPQTIRVEASEDWKPYSVRVPMTVPYPGPRTGEILVTCFYAGDQPAWIDDLEVRRATVDPEPRPLAPVPAALTEWPQNGDFEAGAEGWDAAQKGAVPSVVEIPGSGHALSLAVEQASKTAAVLQTMSNVGKLAGKTIRVWVDVAYPAITEPASNWAGVVVDLVSIDDAGKAVNPEPSEKPFWLPIGHSAKPGEFRTISGEFPIPTDSESVILNIQLQKGVKKNAALIDNVRIEVVGAE